MSLASVTTPDAEGRLDVPDGWTQGRGAYGGLVIGSLVRAIDRSAGEQVGDATRTVRSVTAEIVAPLESGPATIELDTLRSGKSVSFVRATLRHRGAVRAHAVGIVAAARPDALTWQELPAPVAPAWQTIAPAEWKPLLPQFIQHFELRIVDGMPMSGGPARALGYVRARDPGAPRDAAYIAELIDVWWPGAMTRFTTMRPMVTIAYTLDIVGSLAGEDPDAPLLYRGNVAVAAEGYCLEQRELWTASGRLIAINHQTLALL